MRKRLIWIGLMVVALGRSSGDAPGVHSTTSGSDVFLGGNYIELGINTAGAFGSLGSSKPTGFTGTTVRNQIGMSTDLDGFGVGTTQSFDYFMLGTPFVGWYAGYKVSGDATTGRNYTDNNPPIMFVGEDIATTIANTSSASALSATTSGTLGGALQIDQAISLGVDNKCFSIVATLKNVSGSSIDNARYMWVVDPDNVVDFEVVADASSFVASDQNPVPKEESPVTGLEPEIPSDPSEESELSVELPDGVSSSDWSGILAEYEKNQLVAHPVEGQPGVLEARNPGQQWLTTFDGAGFLVEPDGAGWQWGLDLLDYGFEGNEVSATGVAGVTADGQRVTYGLGSALEEWFINGTSGLEHGFTVNERPAGEDGPLLLDLAVLGGLHPEVLADGSGVRFVDDQGATVVNYTGLKVWDANGQVLEAEFEPAGKGLRLAVQESGAVYPLTIDPTAQQAYLKASNTGAGDNFGFSVAVSGDTVVVGAYNEDGSATGVDGTSDESAAGSGAAYVFVRSGTTWTQQAYLKASNSQAGDQFGYSVSVSGDTVVVGAYLEDSNATGVGGDQNNNSASNSGAAYVFVRANNVWSQQAYLKASNSGAMDLFGYSVSVSGDTVVVGAYQEDSNATGVGGDQNDNSAGNSGAAYVFVRANNVWSQHAYLNASNSQASDFFSRSVSVSGDTVVVGADGEDSNATGVGGDQNDNSASLSGAAYVFSPDTTAPTVSSVTSSASDGSYKAGSVISIQVNFSESVTVTGTPQFAAPHLDPFEAVEVEELTSGFTSDFGVQDTVFGASNDPLDLLEGVALEEIHSSESVASDTNPVLGPDKIHESVEPVDRVLLIDSRVPNPAEIGSAVLPGTDVFLLNSVEDGMLQIATALKDYSDLASVQIFSDDMPGLLEIGRGPPNNPENIGLFASEWAVIASSLITDGVLLLLGSGVGEGGEGRVFVEAISRMTGVDVAVYSDREAGYSADEKWSLDAQAGLIESSPSFPDISGSNLQTDVPDGLSADDWLAISNQVQQLELRVMPGQGDSQGNLRAVNGPQQFGLEFDASGVAVRSNVPSVGQTTGAVLFGLEGYGYGTDQLALGNVDPVINGDRVEYRFGDITEWYVNGEAGLEQGFDLEKRPADTNSSESGTVERPLRFDIGFQTVLRTVIGSDQQSVQFVDETGMAVYTYDKLFVYDATGRQLKAWIEPVEELGTESRVGNSVAIRVDDTGAVYPIVVDPTFSQQQQLTASDGAASDKFGASVAVSGDTAIVGATSANSDKGAAYVFVRSGTTWTQQAQLTASDGAASDNLGVSVAISGNTAVVGATGHNSSRGAAYVFVRSGTSWSEQQKLTASTAQANDFFGSSVAIDGDTVVVGARSIKTSGGFFNVGESSERSNRIQLRSLSSAGGNSKGAAYVFVRAGTTWSQQQKLTASDGANGDRFGVSVAISGDTVVVGADVNASNLNSTLPYGAIYVFVRSGTTWSQQAKKSTSADQGRFGSAVTISGDTLVVGAGVEDILIGPPVGSDLGAVYIFVRSGSDWSLEKKLIPSDGASSDQFGTSVSISGNTLVVGANGDDVGSNSNQGSAYLFTRSGTTWTQQQKLTASDSAASDGFGVSVAIDSETIIVGASSDDVSSNSDQGSAYVFAAADTTAPTVSSVSSSTSDGSYKAGSVISIQVNFSESVTVTGTPQLTLETGSTDRIVNYASGSGSASLTFTYTVQSGDMSSDLDYVATTSLALNGGTIKDAAGNDATVTLASPGAANSLGANKAIVIDTTVPTVSSVSSSTSDGSYKAGDPISIQVTFSESVTVTGTPRLTLETGTTDRTVDFASGSGSTSLTFTYTVQSGDTASDLDYVATTSLALNSGTIKDAAGDDATLTLASPGAANSLGANKAIVIDTTAPTVGSVSSSTSDGSYKAGEPISIQVTFSESVTVTGTPQLTLETGSTDRIVNYASGSGSASLTFTYTVQSGDTSSDLDYVATTSLALNSGTIKDAAGNDATLTLAGLGAANSLANNKAIVIDTTAPSISSVSIPNATMKIGDTVTVTITVTSDADTYTLATSTLGGFSLSGLAKVSDTSYTASFTVASGGTDVAAGSDISVSVVLNDSASNANSAFTTAISQNADRIDANRPAISSVSIPNATMKIGDTVTVTITVTSDADTYTLGTSTVGGFSLSGLSKSSDTSYTASFTVTSGGTDVAAGSDVPVSVVLNDSASNAATAFTTAISQGNDALDANRPAVTDAKISISGATGTGGAYKIGDTVTATWNNTSATGDANTDTISAVTVNFSAFGGGTGVSASNSSDTWTATYVIVSGSVDGTSLNVSVTATDNAGNSTTTADSTGATVDNVAPTVTDAKISISGATGTGGVYKIGDTVTATWNNTSGTGDANTDTISTVTVNFSVFGGGTAVAASNSSGTWTATLAITEDGGGVIESSNLNISVTATDNAGNATTTADTSNATLDNHTPAAPSNLDLTASSDSGISSTDNITNDNRPTIDGIAEANSRVELFYSGTNSLGTATADISGSWTLTVGTLSDGTYSVTATAADSAGNTSAASDALSLIVDTGAPGISGITDQVINEDNGTGAVTFTVSDALAAAVTLSVASTSSDTTLVPLVNIVLGGGGATRTMTVTRSADLHGSATITLTVADPAGNSSSRAIQVTVNPVNDAPSFVTGADQTVLEDAGTQTEANWARSLSTGPSNESSQTLTFQVSNDSTALFSVQPAITSNGTLTYTPAANANGIATVTVSLTDDGGTANGGVDTSGAETFTITVTAVNDVPGFVKGSSQTVLEDSGAQSVANWATGMSAGPADESGQTLTFQVTNDNDEIFSVQPAIDSAGMLTYTPSSDRYGSATVTVRLRDSGGTVQGGINLSAAQTFSLNVTPVNDAPVVNAISDLTVPEDSSEKSVTITGIGAGGRFENQRLSVWVDSSNPSLVPPPSMIYPGFGDTAVLKFRPAADANGTVTIFVAVFDDGGLENGGVDSLTESFQITVTPVGDPPTLTSVIPIDGALEDASFEIVYQVLANASDARDIDGDAISFRVENVLSGSLRKGNEAIAPGSTLISSGESVAWNPPPNAHGTLDAFSVRAFDGGMASDRDVVVRIVTAPVNDPPLLEAIGDQGILEDSPLVLELKASDLETPASRLRFDVRSSNSDLLPESGLFFSESGGSGSMVVLVPASDQNGSAPVTVTVTDEGGLESVQSFVLVVEPVNDAPRFVVGADEVIHEDAGQRTAAGWATNIEPGPDDEADQKVEFVVSVDQPWLFSEPPGLSANGTLSYTTFTNAFGQATVTVSLRDDGGMANGGRDMSTPETFTIRIEPVNDPPALSDIIPLKGATNGVPLIIDYFTLAAASSATDDDGDPIYFQLDELLGGRLTQEGAALVPNQSLLRPEEAWVWTPDRHGIVDAFTVKAFDGSDVSATNALVRIEVASQSQFKIVASDGASGDFFAFPLSISGETVLVGAYRANGLGREGSGAAYVYQLGEEGTNWVEQAKLVRQDGSPGDWFGYAVAISGDTLVVGASQAMVSGEELAGAAFVYERIGTNWFQQARLTASDGGTLSRFGSAVALDGGTIVVGARQATVAGKELAGAAYVFDRDGTNWVEQAKLAPEDGKAEDWFGGAVSIWRNTIVVGAFSADVADRLDAGAAYIFNRNGGDWTQEVKLIASDGGSADHFGSAVAVSGDTVAVGAFLADVSDRLDTGATYLFSRQGGIWREEAKLTVADSASMDWFGSSVSLSGDTVAVGASQADQLGERNTGAVYVYEREGAIWAGPIKWVANDAATDDRFGTSVAVSGSYAAVGAFLAEIDGATHSGACYVLTLRQPELPSVEGGGFVPDPANSVSVASVREVAPSAIPTTPEQAFRLYNPTFSSKHGISIWLSAPIGQKVQLQVSEDFERWTVIQEVTVDSPMFEFLDSQVEFVPKKIYRLVPISKEVR